MPFAFPAKYDGACAFMQCAASRPGTIQAGETVGMVYNHGTKSLYHVDCYEAHFGKPLTVRQATPAAAAVEASDPASALGALAGALGPYLTDALRRTAADLAEDSRALIAETVAETVAEVVPGMIAEAVRGMTRRLRIERADAPPMDFEHAHQAFPLLVQRMNQARQRRRNVLLWGPAGAGKSHAAEQGARALGLSFAYMSCTPMSAPSQLVGYMTPGGEYIGTNFTRAYSGGGVFLLDEIDNAPDSLLTALNSALAGEAGSFPCGMVPRHPDFVMMAGANTSLLGGDYANPERRRQGQAQRSRWTFMRWEYDADLERGLALARCADAGPWVDWVHAVREWSGNPSNGVRDVLATPRASLAGAEDLAAFDVADLTLDDIADSYVRSGIPDDQWARVLSACPLPADPRCDND